MNLFIEVLASVVIFSGVILSLVLGLMAAGSMADQSHPKRLVVFMVMVKFMDPKRLHRACLLAARKNY